MSKVLIIAEAGINHNGSIDLAYKLIDKAVEAGVDVVKFQTAIPELVMSKTAPKAEYQKQDGTVESQLEMVKKLLLPLDAFKSLKTYCDSVGITFLSTPFDLVSIDFLDSLGMDTCKIPSGEITNYPYLKKVGGLNRKIILSTGMSTIAEIEAAIALLVRSGSQRENITLLHCNTDYPTPMRDVNLNAMLTLKNTFNLNVGYSDHTKGIEVPIAATALGATVIEKHFTLDNNLPGPDHKASLEPAELKQMVTAIRNIEAALGDGVKKPTESESKNIAIARRSIHYASDLAAGHILTEQDLVMKRPGDGVSPMLVTTLIGKVTARAVQEDTKLQLEDLK